MNSSSDETSPLLQDPRHLLQQVISSHHASPIPTIPEEAGATHRFGLKLLASLVVDSIPGTNDFLRGMFIPPWRALSNK
jgi:hypothetical protein